MEVEILKEKGNIYMAHRWELEIEKIVVRGMDG